jgi:glycosyltransferase involved in cell wall biosynthesis
LSITKSIQIIVPCYNPLEGWEQVLTDNFKRLEAEVSDLNVVLSLAVVNDGSPSNATAGNVQTLNQLLNKIQFIGYEQNRGKGYALREGVRKTNADYYVVTDTDFPYTLASMKSVIVVLLEKGGVAAGNRNTDYYQKVPLFRKLLSKWLRWMLRNVLKITVTDSQCGLKGFDNAGKVIFLETTIDRFLFDLEFLMLTNSRVEVTPVPVELRSGVVFSKVGGNILLTEGRNFLKLFFKQLKF